MIRSTLHLKHGGIRRLALLAVFAGLALTTVAETDWRSRVTASERTQVNPLAGQDTAAAAGQQLFTDNCSRCHGADANGKSGRPSLRTSRTAGETDGELFWILKHGNRWSGMPAWNVMDDDHLWQLVTWLRSQQPASTDKK